jgi:hypothetical protein
MEEIIDFDEWIKNFKKPDPVYWAVYDLDTGKVSGIYPNDTADRFSNKVKIDNEVAESIQKGEISLHRCYIESSSGDLEIVEEQSLKKIDDVLHRVIDTQWTDELESDVYIVHDTEKKSLIVELSERYNGTRKSTVTAKRKIHWNGDTEVSLLVTDYNDPNIVHHILHFKINELVGQHKEFKNLEFPSNYSIYTRRLFKKYIFEKL